MKRLRQVSRNPLLLAYWTRILLGDFCIKLAVKFRNSLLLALGWRLYLNKNDLGRPVDKSGEIPHSSTAKRTLIILDRSGGNEDIQSAFRGVVADYKIRFLNRETVRNVFFAFLPTTVNDDQYISTDPKVETAKLAYRAFLRSALKKYQTYFGSIAFVQFNIYYYAEVELASACTELGIPFLAAQKECLRPLKAWEEIEQQLRIARGPFTGSRISIYNRSGADAFVRAGVVDESRIDVVGCARMDDSHLLRQRPPSRQKQPMVVYYLIDPRACTPLSRLENGEWVRGVFDQNGIEQLWVHLINRVNQSVLKVAQQHSDIRFLCKGKSGFSTEQIFALGSRIPENVTLASDGVGHHLLEKATVAIGFNTTAILEAIAAGVPTIVPQLYADTENLLRPYTFDFDGAALCPTTQTEFEQMIVNEARRGYRYTELTLQQKTVLERLMGNPDGKSGDRLRAFIDRSLCKNGSH